jgi:hydroxypyruvate isomerase
MERKEFLRNSIIGGASFMVPDLTKMRRSYSNSDQPFHLNYAIHDGMFKNSAGDDLLDQIRFAYEHGFRAIEDNGLMGRSPERQQQIGDLLGKLGMQMGVFVLEKGGNGANTLAAGKQEYLEIFLKGCRDAVEVSKRCGGKLTTVVPGDFERNLPEGIQTAHIIEALRKGAEILEPQGNVMVLEPLSDTPDLFLRTADQAFAICMAVDSPSCKILFDMYHIQRNCGDLIHNIDLNFSQIGYFQIGNNPGRNEPGTGEMDYRNIFKHIYTSGFRGVLGMEHGKSKPGKEGEQTLIQAYREADNFL